MEQAKMDAIKEIFAGGQGALSVSVERKYAQVSGEVSNSEDGWVFKVKVVKSDALQSAIELFSVDGETRWNLTTFGSRANEVKRPLYRGYFVSAITSHHLDCLLGKGKTVNLLMGNACDVEALEHYIRDYLPSVFKDAVNCAMREEGTTVFRLKAVLEEDVE